MISTEVKKLKDSVGVWIAATVLFFAIALAQGPITRTEMQWLITLHWAVCTALAFVGFGGWIKSNYHLSRARGYHGAFCILGMTGIIGPIILLIMPDKHEDQE